MRKSLLAAEPAKEKAPRRKGESVEERRARRAATQARHGRDIDKREQGRAASKAGVGGERAGRARRRAK
jgi:hypothetical protein